MKHLYYILAFAMLSVIAACEDDNDSHLITSINDVTFPPEGGSQVIKIESNTDWHIVTSAEWVSVYPSVGSQNKEVTITATPNNNTTGTFVTESETDVIADIAKGEYLGNGQWNFFVNMGYDTDYYRIYATDNPNNAFIYNDPILWYIAQINFNKNQWYSATRYNSTGWTEPTTTIVQVSVPDWS